MYLIVEENANCGPEERRFSVQGEPRTVRQIRGRSPTGEEKWWDVAGVANGGTFGDATAVLIEDSGAGTAWLVFGGEWGIRCREAGSTDRWSLDDARQWGEPFRVLDASGADLR